MNCLIISIAETLIHRHLIVTLVWYSLILLSRETKLLLPLGSSRSIFLLTSKLMLYTRSVNFHPTYSFAILGIDWTCSCLNNRLGNSMFLRILLRAVLTTSAGSVGWILRLQLGPSEIVKVLLHHLKINCSSMVEIIVLFVHNSIWILQHY